MIQPIQVVSLVMMGVIFWDVNDFLNLGVWFSSLGILGWIFAALTTSLVIIHATKVMPRLSRTTLFGNNDDLE